MSGIAYAKAYLAPQLKIFQFAQTRPTDLGMVGLLYAAGIGKSDLCCYCAAEGIQQQQDNDLKKKY
jgi:hypothetical protein